eukprot:jgi/Mesen1/1836/ME000142S00994
MGYMVGNGCTDTEVDGNALVPFVYGHGMISIDLFQDLERECNGNYWNASGRCLTLLEKVDQDVKDVNIYDILEPCYHGDSAARSKFAAREAERLHSFHLQQQQQQMMPQQQQEGVREEGEREDMTSATAAEAAAAAATAAGVAVGAAGAAKQPQMNPIRLPQSFVELGGSNPRALPVRARMVGRAWPLRTPMRTGPVTLWGQRSANEDPYVPCVDDTIGSVWLNDEGVRAAIHARPVSDIGPWVLCTEKIDYYENAGSMLPIHASLTLKGYRALIYSGDHDMCVPYTGSELWTRNLGYAVTDKWRPWYLAGQVAGYTRGYDHNLTFATIAGSGHTVPEYKPAEALAFFQRWLSGKPL